MNGPPADIEPRKLWQKLQELPRPCSDPIDFPRRDVTGNPLGQLRIWVLDQDERSDAAAAAELYARRKLKDSKATDLGYEDVYANEVVVQILWRACRDVEQWQSHAAWPTPELLRKITTEECAVLFEHYLTTQKQLGPIISDLSERDYEAWIEKLSKGGGAYPLGLLSSDMKDVLLIGMALRLHALRTDTSSVGSQPEEQSTSDGSSSAAAVGDSLATANT